MQRHVIAQLVYLNLILHGDEYIEGVCEELLNVSLGLCSMSAAARHWHCLQAAPMRASTRAKAASRASAQIAQQGAAQIAAAKADKEEKLQR